MYDHTLINHVYIYLNNDQRIKLFSVVSCNSSISQFEQSYSFLKCIRTKISAREICFTIWIKKPKILLLDVLLLFNNSEYHSMKNTYISIYVVQDVGPIFSEVFSNHRSQQRHSLYTENMEKCMIKRPAIFVF